MKTDLVDEKGNVDIDSEAAVKAMEFIIELKKYAPVGTENYNSPEVKAAIANRQTAMSIVWPAWVPKLNATVWEVAVTPGARPMIGAWLLGVPVSSKNKELAFDFILFVTSRPIQKVLALEVGCGSGEAARTMLEDLGYVDVRLTPDLAGIDRVVEPISVGQMLAASDNYPLFATACDRAHAAGGIVGWAHGGGVFNRLHEALPIEAALGKVDFVEVIQFNMFFGYHFWRQLLNCGLRLAGTGGSDFPFGVDMLAPGAEPGRLCIWTEGALRKMEELS